MSTHSNPFVQGGWYGQSPYSLGPDTTGTPSSAYGALPMVGGQAPPQDGWAVFNFTDPKPNVLNSIVVGPELSAMYKISTNQSLEGYTQFRDVENKAAALIEWINEPKVEIRGSVAKVNASEWLPAYMDQRFGR